MTTSTCIITCCIFIAASSTVSSPLHHIRNHLYTDVISFTCRITPLFLSSPLHITLITSSRPPLPSPLHHINHHLSTTFTVTSSPPHLMRRSTATALLRRAQYISRRGLKKWGHIMHTASARASITAYFYDANITRLTANFAKI